MVRQQCIERDAPAPLVRARARRRLAPARAQHALDARRKPRHLRRLPGRRRGTRQHRGQDVRVEAEALGGRERPDVENPERCVAAGTQLQQIAQHADPRLDARGA